MSCVQRTFRDTASEESFFMQLQELRKVIYRQTEKIDSVNECLFTVAESMKKVFEVQKDYRNDGDLIQLFRTNLQPILVRMEDLSSLILQTNARNESRLPESSAVDLTAALSSHSESLRLKLGKHLDEHLSNAAAELARQSGNRCLEHCEDFASLQQAISKLSNDSSMFLQQMRTDLAELKQTLSKDLHEKLDEHLPTNAFLSTLAATPPSTAGPDKLSATRRAVAGPNKIVATPPYARNTDREWASPREPIVSPRVATSDARSPMQEPEPPDPNPVMLPQRAASNVSVKTNKLAMRGAEEGGTDSEELELKLNTAMSTVFVRDDNVAAYPFDPPNYYKKTGWAQAIARTSAFDKLTNVMIVINALYLGIESNYTTGSNIYGSSWGFVVATQFFAIYFSFELLVRFLAYELPRYCLKDGWFMFDAFLVSTMILDVWIILPISYAVEGSHPRVHFQPLRLVRLFKLLRMARLVEVFPELVLMTKALFRSMRAISSTMILVSIMLYAGGIFMHMLLKKNERLNVQFKQDYDLNFATLTDCFWTLLVCGVLQLDNTSLIMTDLVYGNKVDEKIAGFAFTLFSLITSLLILQMLIGVLCDVIARIGEEQREAEAIALVRQEVLGELLELEAGNGTISCKGLHEVLNSPKTKALLRKLKVNRLFFCELANMLFVAPDSNVSIKVVMELLILCRGENTTSVDVLASAFCFLTNELLEMETRMMSELLNPNFGTSSSRPSRIAQAADLLKDFDARYEETPEPSRIM